MKVISIIFVSLILMSFVSAELDFGNDNSNKPKVIIPPKVVTFDNTTFGANVSVFWDRNVGSGFLFPETITDFVGIGTDTPETALEIIEANGDQLLLGTSEGAGWRLSAEKGTGDFAFLKDTGVGSTYSGIISGDKWCLGECDAPTTEALLVENTGTVEFNEYAGSNGFHYDIDNVLLGIGTSTPTHELNVVGSANITGKLELGFEDNANAFTSLNIHHDADSGGLFSVQKDGNNPFVAFTGFDLGTSRVLYFGGGEWGDTNTPVNDSNQIRFYTDPDYSGGINEGKQRVVIAGDGNVSFVNTGASEASPEASIEIVPTGASIMVSSTRNADGDIFIVDGNNRVGIGTSTPTHELNVVGDINISNGDLILDTDGKKIFFGGEQDASINYDGTNLVINPQEIGGGLTSFTGETQAGDGTVIHKFGSSIGVIRNDGGVSQLSIITNNVGSNSILRLQNEQGNTWDLNLRSNGVMGFTNTGVSNLDMNTSYNMFNPDYADIDTIFRTNNANNVLIVDGGSDSVLFGYGANPGKIANFSNEGITFNQLGEDRDFNILGGSVGIGTSTPRNVLDVVNGNISFNNFVFSNLTKNSFIDDEVFGIYMTNDGVEAPHFWIQSGGAGQASGIARSFMIVNENTTILNSANRTSCSTWAESFNKTLRIDCNTTTTGADLLVGDDMQVFGTIYTEEYTPRNARINDSDGTLTSGDIEDLTDMFGNDLVYTEVSGSPGLNVVFNLSILVDQPKNVIARWNYSGSHELSWDLYDYDSSTWKPVRGFSATGEVYSSMTMVLPQNLVGDYIDEDNNNTLQIRVFHPSNGNTNHLIAIDYLGVKY